MNRELKEKKMSSDKLAIFLVYHLNRIHCAKSHLLERLPEIKDHPHFADLVEAISKTLSDVEGQLSRVDKIYLLLNSKYDFEKCDGMIGLMEENFDTIVTESNNAESRDLSILFYLQNIKSIQVASYGMIKLIAAKLGQTEIEQLLADSFNEAGIDLPLFQHITGKFLQ